MDSPHNTPVVMYDSREIAPGVETTRLLDGAGPWRLVNDVGARVGINDIGPMLGQAILDVLEEVATDCKDVDADTVTWQIADGFAPVYTREQALLVADTPDLLVFEAEIDGPEWASGAQRPLIAALYEIGEAAARVAIEWIEEARDNG